MPYSVLLIGATGSPGFSIAKKLAKYKDQFKRVAYLTATAKSTQEKEAKYALVPLERVVGDLEDPETYRGFDILISATYRKLVLDQIKYFNAAFAGGVKHVYPSEFGPDFNDPVLNIKEAFFAPKIQVRKALEERVSKDSSLGYTYVMTGIFSDFMIETNLLGLSGDKKTITFLGEPDALLTSTHTDDIGEFVALSTLPSHLPSLNERRELPLEGSTMKVADYFDTVSRVLGHPISVEYLTLESSFAFQEEQRALGNEDVAAFTSVKRIVGFGSSLLSNPVNPTYPEHKAKTWEDTVKTMLGA